MPKSRPRRGSPLLLTPAFGLFKPSKEIVLKNIWIFGPLYAVPLFFWVHSWIWSNVTTTSHPHWFTRFYAHGTLSPNWGTSPISNLPDLLIGFSILWFLLIVVAGTIAQLMAVIGTYEGSLDKPLSFDALWRRVKQIGLRLVGLYIVVGLVVILGFIFFIIPGLIFLRRYFLSPYVMLDKNCGIREAMDRSAAMSKPNSGSIWGIIGVMLLISLAGIIPLIGSLIAFILGMLYSVAPALRYQELKKLS